VPALLLVLAVTVGLSLAVPAGFGPAGSGPFGSASVAGASPLAPTATTVVDPVDEPVVENPLGTEPGEQVGSSTAEDRRVWAVVAALVGVALALTVLTVRYWRQTRPPGTRAGGSRSTRSRRSRRRDAAEGPAQAPVVDPAGERSEPRPAPVDDDLDDLFVDD
jgi:hypothetical protein